MTINATGEVTACCRDAGKRLKLGQLNNEDNSLTKIWNGDVLNNARDLHEKR